MVVFLERHRKQWLLTDITEKLQTGTVNQGERVGLWSQRSQVPPSTICCGLEQVKIPQKICHFISKMKAITKMTFLVIVDFMVV